MIFSATFACPRCKLRFARRAQCPSCGGTAILSLTTTDGRARYRAATRGGASGQGVVPLLQGLWLAIADAVARTFAILAGRSAPPPRALLAAPARSRVFSPGEAMRGDTTLTGIARRASVELESLLSKEPCLLFGLRGSMGDADVADADGGDFDLELPSGERVLVSLEHAHLVAPAAALKPAPAITPALADFLESRAIQDPAEDHSFEEHLVRDGDQVTVIGTLLGGKVTSLGGAAGTRVLAGTEERPLIVEK